MRESPFSDLCDVTLLDFNEETLQSTSGVLNDLCQTHGRTAGIETIHRSVHQLLKQASTGDAVMKWDHYDLVYCAGLFDYLSQRVCKRLTEIFYMLSKPGGKVAVTNVSASNPSIGWMEYILEWNLVYRDQNEMLELVPRQINQDQATLIADVTGVNLFLEVPKPRLS
ncbi:MAG: extracellular factor (EF) 3-hydroxypalmitic acid methyl ester biosynthesis protein [Akkermansiaceae bacterium]